MEYYRRIGTKTLRRKQGQRGVWFSWVLVILKDALKPIDGRKKEKTYG